MTPKELHKISRIFEIEFRHGTTREEVLSTIVEHWFETSPPKEWYEVLIRNVESVCLIFNFDEYKTHPNFIRHLDSAMKYDFSGLHNSYSKNVAMKTQKNIRKIVSGREIEKLMEVIDMMER